jgi:hypothetical protein
LCYIQRKSLQTNHFCGLVFSPIIPYDYSPAKRGERSYECSPLLISSILTTSHGVLCDHCHHFEWAMLVAVDPSLVVAVVVMHSRQVIVVAETATAVFVMADSNRAVILGIETVAAAERAVGSSLVAADIALVVGAVVPNLVVVEAIA